MDAHGNLIPLEEFCHAPLLMCPLLKLTTLNLYSIIHFMTKTYKYLDLQSIM